MHSIYWQLHHVYHNINFSRISVRNNHAITECLMLYLSGKLFPFFQMLENGVQKEKSGLKKRLNTKFILMELSTVFHELSSRINSTPNLGYPAS